MTLADKRKRLFKKKSASKHEADAPATFLSEIKVKEDKGVKMQKIKT